LIVPEEMELVLFSVLAIVLFPFRRKNITSFSSKTKRKAETKASKSQLYEQDSVNMPKLAFGVPVPRAEGGSVERQKL